MIADLGDEAPALCRILHRQYPQPAHAPRLCPGVQPVLRLVRGSRPDASGDPAHDVAIYIEQLQNEISAPSVKQQLAAVPMLFDWLVIGQVVPTNPAAAVRGSKHVVKTGKTPVLEGAEWRKLLKSIPDTTLRDLRDRAFIATLTYSFAGSTRP
jgi:integrase